MVEMSGCIGVRSLVEAARRGFVAAFGQPPAAAAVAPGRVNLIGDHVDYCGGLVLPMAIDRRIVACAGCNDRGVLRVSSAGRPDSEGVFTVERGTAPGEIAPAWLRYPAGVDAELRRLGLFGGRDGIDVCFASDLPEGAGLSSSAALESAACVALETLAGRSLDPLTRARVCQSAEHRYAGVPCGIMDQYTVCHAVEGSALLLDCGRLTHRDVPIPPSVAVLVVDSGVKHELAAAAYADRRRECEQALAKIVAAIGARPSFAAITWAEVEAAQARGTAALAGTELRRVRHVLSEIARTASAAGAMERGDTAEFGRLMTESHASLRDDYEVSCSEVDEIVASLTRLDGVCGARMTGGGFGGCVVAVLDAGRARTVLDQIRSGLPGGRLCFLPRASGGARAVAL